MMPGNSRFDRELEELLASLGELPPRETPRNRFQRTLRTALYRWQETVSRFRWNGIATEQMMLVGIVLIVLAYFLRLGSTVVAGYLGLVGVLVFFAAFGLAVAGNRRRRAPRWRGQVVSFSSARVPWTERLRRWLRRNLR
jgi:hypothetical protein